MASCQSEHSLDSLRNRLRIRELSRYYCATSAPGPTTSKPHNDLINPELSQTDPSEGRPLAHQPNLTALAQLAAFRLNTQRSIISIIDNQTQYILAEATRSGSIYDGNIHAPGDGPIIGAYAFPYHLGVCPKTLDAFLGGKVQTSGPDNIADPNYCLITDLLTEKLTRDQPLLRKLPPVLRYYLEVPLKSESGYVLGSICVVDPVPRLPGPTDVDQLTEIAKLVVDQLEHTRIKEDRMRAQRLLEGVSHFVQGQSSLSKWSRATEGQTIIPDVQASPMAVSSARLSPDRVSHRSITKQDQVLSQSNNTRSASSATRSARLVSRTSESIASTSRSSALNDDTAASSEVQPLSSVTTDIGSESSSMGPVVSDPQLPTSSSGGVKKAFSRASNLIRESMDLDATCFLELPQNARSHRGRRHAEKPKNQLTSTKSVSNGYDSLTDESIHTSTSDMSSGPEFHTSDSETFCHRMGFSTAANSSVADSSVDRRFLTIPAKLLNSLAQRYPGGHIFHFDEAGVITSSGDEQTDDMSGSDTTKKRKRNVTDKLTNYFQAARSMIFFPLYDNERQHVYAAFLGWTNDPARALQRDEIVYVSAFTDSLMCEIMRLNALELDKAKSNFISSISHELRSPLHGILAACQLLSESKQYPHQQEFIQMVDTCAHTLLDTMENVLDYAKINRFTEQQKKGRLTRRLGPGKGTSPRRVTYSLVSKVNLLSIIEDTVVSVAVSSQQPAHNTRAVGRGSGTLLDGRQTETCPKASPVPIMLNIHPYATWLFDTEPGSWRRIMMNLVGNSMKYTQQGHITIDLRCYDVQGKNGTQTCMAELKVTDTGQGISEEYLRHRLYTPFAQENNLSVGSGLGLSMVNQIVASLKGNINVQSEIDTGTQIVVKIPLKKSDTAGCREVPDVSAESTEGRSIAFAGFNSHPPLSESATGILSPRSTALLALKASISDIATEWLGLRVVRNNPDIYVVEESFLESNLEQFDQDKNSLLIVGMDGRNDRTTNKISRAKYSYVLPPIGPRGLRHALDSLMKRDTDTPDHHEDAHRQQNRDNEPATPPKTPIFDSRPFTTKSDSTEEIQDVSRSSSDQVSDNDDAQHSNCKQLDNAETEATEVHDTEALNHPTESAGDPKQCVLLVDDNDINLRILIACIKRLPDVSYMTATNGKEALSKFQSAVENGDTVPVVFMDVSMPIMDGIESTRRIRAYEKTKSIDRAASSKIIALTGLGSGEAQKEIEGCGFSLYLRKPVNLQIVREILADSGMVAPT